jgi:Hydroxyacylglutathione hydrolase C-terminus
LSALDEPYASTIGDELKHNVFMRTDEKHLQDLAGLRDPVLLLGKLREMKNNGSFQF